ncbi:glucosylceramidase [Niastella yeongjuensis]|uniref:Glucosylceramidase n=1 Tax=Niastella yeongjuensis TaxID=354355 RepID=A0A1V9EVY0_9BACT|nr:glycoside hydrolase family 30 beta sandwich domain-containing protein [Niastella yeongjuensis]OQP50309.1 glucosylceramidase [Niastella yeongjuensis]SEN40185.1 glucosylceramidase [Niastella yeongjuensis]
MFNPVVLLFCIMLGGNCKKNNEKENPPPPPDPPVANEVLFYLTRGDRDVLFNRQNVKLVFSGTGSASTTIEVDTTQTFQSIDGFGYTLTGGSASLLNSLPATTLDPLLKELFLWDSTNIGVSYLRISIGASDLSASTFTYDDMPAGQTDSNLVNFSIDKEKQDLIPILKKIVALNPAIKILGSPWSAPVWMKTNDSFKGGSLKPEYYAAYANYFVKYIQAMKAEGIPIDAITPQNEPLHGGNNPSMVMQANEQTTFIKNNLGPAFAAAGINTKIIAYDHNADRPDYPLTVLNDAAANPYVNGSAFHLYGGSITALTQVHEAHPDKHVYFTEQWVGGPGNFPGDLKWHVENLIIGATRNWSRNVLEWNLAADPGYQPHTPGGCTTCLGALTISSTVTRNVSYYIIAHASKFVRPGSVRIGSKDAGSIVTVAFRNPEGKKVLIALNKGSNTESFNIKFNGKMVTTSLNGGAVGTYVW